MEATHKAVEVATHAWNRGCFLDLLSELKFDRFRRTGLDEDLEDSVQLATQAVESIPEDDSMRPGIVNNLAVKLRQRSHKKSGTEDIERGIWLCKKALSLPTQYVHSRQRLLSTLAILLGLRFRRQGEMEDLDAIETAPPMVRKRLERHGLASRGELLPDISRDIIALPEEDDGDSDFLSWLWISCVRLTLAKLESHGLELNGEQRVWWIGTGAAGSFPFHVAGMHYSCPAECTMMKVISSYAPSIKTLKFSMGQSTESAHLYGRQSLLFVGMPTTPGGSGPLPGVLEEESVIRDVCANKYKFEARKHPTADEVLEEMTKSKLVHFACHGSSDPKVPSDSHLLLQKDSEIGPAVDRLSVERLSRVSGKDRSFLAFLSACSTAEVSVASKVADEAIHLASIVQVAGFAHTIGALWSASDKACVQVAGEFYRHPFEDEQDRLSNGKVARALHLAVRKVKMN